MNNPDLLFIGIVNSKGGLGKSLLAAEVTENVARIKPGPWTVVEIEHRAKMTQKKYQHPEGARVMPIPLFTKDERSGLTDAGIAPLDQMWDLIPPDNQPDAVSRIVVDFGASAFQSFMLWGLERRGLRPFRKAGFRFVFFVPVQAADDESADFFNENAEALRTIGKLVLVKNLREGNDFSLLNPTVVADTPVITFLYTGLAVSNELQQKDRRLTFSQLANLSTASRRAKLDAEICADHFTKQLREICPMIGIN